MRIKKLPPFATEEQKILIKELAQAFGRRVEDLVCIASQYRTTGLSQMYKYEAEALIKALKQQIKTLKDEQTFKA